MAEGLRIGIVCYPTYGGSGVVATELGVALADRGHTVHFITYDRPVRLVGFSERIGYHSVTPAEYPLFEFVPYESALVSKIVQVVLREGLDLLHVHYAIPHASSAYMAREILRTHGVHLPVITTLHGTDITLVGQDESYAPVVTFSLNQSDSVTAVSDSLRQSTLENFAVTTPIEVIPNFIDLHRFRPSNGSFRRQLAEEDLPVLLHVSNFRPVKRVPDVIEVFRRVRAEREVKLLLVGDGPERKRVFELVKKYQLSSCVLFLGQQEAVEHLLPMADIFLLPSETESFGLAALEAMAAGLAVVGTQTGGVPELVRHEQDGFLAPVGDVDAMAGYVNQLLESPDALHAFKKAAQKRAQDFAIEKIVPLYEALYQGVLNALPA